MTGEELRTAVLDGLALVEAQLGRDREGIGAILAASDDPDHLRTMAEVAAAVASYAIGELFDLNPETALLEYLVRLRGWGLDVEQGEGGGSTT